MIVLQGLEKDFRILEFGRVALCEAAIDIQDWHLLIVRTWTT